LTLACNRRWIAEVGVAAALAMLVLPFCTSFVTAKL